MARTLVLDEVYLVVRVSADLPARRARLLHRVIATTWFTVRLRIAARDALERVHNARVEVRVAR